jgi:hypothetical protein
MTGNRWRSSHTSDLASGGPIRRARTGTVIIVSCLDQVCLSVGLRNSRRVSTDSPGENPVCLNFATGHFSPPWRKTLKVFVQTRRRSRREPPCQTSIWHCSNVGFARAPGDRNAELGQRFPLWEEMPGCRHDWKSRLQNGGACVNRAGVRLLPRA